MLLGPDSLEKESLRKIIKQKKYKKALQKYTKKKINWSDSSLSDLKKEIRFFLRKQQQNRCIYCRRIIKLERKNTNEDIEHFLDKSKDDYRKWSFSCVNLSISCHACNFQKSTKDMGDNSIRTSLSLKHNSGTYKWIHPYFHSYHQNIEIRSGWIYSIKRNAPNPIQADNLIRECALDEVQTIEKNAEEIKETVYQITLEVSEALRNKDYVLAEELNNKLESYQEESWFNS
jgi:uncharacterized protein (TIGR02646 family)